RLGVRARDVVEDVRVRKDLVRSLELRDALFVLPVGDEPHPPLEVRFRLGTGVCKGARCRGEDGPKQQAGRDRSEGLPAHVVDSVAFGLARPFASPRAIDQRGDYVSRILTSGTARRSEGIPWLGSE